MKALLCALALALCAWAVNACDIWVHDPPDTVVVDQNPDVVVEQEAPPPDVNVHVEQPPPPPPDVDIHLNPPPPPPPPDNGG